MLFQAASCEYIVFFFQAEDGIRDLTVTGVQTCALPIFAAADHVRDRRRRGGGPDFGGAGAPLQDLCLHLVGCDGRAGGRPGGRAVGLEDGRGAWWGRGESLGGGALFKKKKTNNEGVR